MMFSSWKILLLLSLVSFASIVRCEDPLEDEDDGSVESDEPIVEDVDMEEGDVESIEEEPLSKGSPDVDVACHVIKYEDNSLPANEFVTVLVGVANSGENEFIVDGIEASFRYPQDFSYYIQNFTHFRYNRVIKSNTESSFMYRFFIHESYHSRSMGLSVNVHYHDTENVYFESSAFNETIKIHEPIEGFDAEAFFLYALLLGIVALILFGLYQFTYTKRSRSSAPVETGTSKGDIDHEWIPTAVLQSTQRSPMKGKGSNGSTKRSPPSSDTETRQRRSAKVE